MIQRVLPYFLLVCFLAVGAAIFSPTICRAPGNASRASCQSNLKQIGLALQQYAQDNGDKFPLRHWSVPVIVYAKTDALFQCPETTDTTGTSDYFLNAHLLKKWLGDTEEPSRSILLGEGQDDVPLNMTLSHLPTGWGKDEKSPSWRHLDGANYGFADGHVKWMKPNTVDGDFTVVRR